MKRNTHMIKLFPCFLVSFDISNVSKQCLLSAVYMSGITGLFYTLFVPLKTCALSTPVQKMKEKHPWRFILSRRSYARLLTMSLFHILHPTVDENTSGNF